MTNIIDVLSILEKLAPSRLAEEWDNVGLQAGSLGVEVHGVLVALNVNEKVMEEAEARGCDLILTHHPLIFQPLLSVSDANAAGRLVQQALRGGISVVAAHTNLDAAPGGLADVMAELAGLVHTRPLSGSPAPWSKLVTFVPAAGLDRVRAALFDAGAGEIGDYRHCSYTTMGTGTFLPMEGARPAIGAVGKDESVEELRLEMVFPGGRDDEIIAALSAVHPYEEPAYDIYPLATRSHESGCGRAGQLEAPVSLRGFAAVLARAFGMDSARFSGDASRTVRRAAVVSGSGAGMIGTAAAVSDVLVTGDLKYHDLTQAEDLGLALIEIPHDICETGLLSLWSESLEQRLAPLGVSVSISAVETCLWHEVQAGDAGPAANTGTDTGNKDGGVGLHHLHVDGGSRGNPGPAAIGAVLEDRQGNQVATLSRAIGAATNNVAEYRALIAGVEMALEHGVRELAVFSDSELVIRQLRGEYKVKNQGLLPLYEEARECLGKLERYQLDSVPREDNARADGLVNQALDAAGG